MEKLSRAPNEMLGRMWEWTDAGQNFEKKTFEGDWKGGKGEGTSAKSSAEFLFKKLSRETNGWNWGVR